MAQLGYTWYPQDWWTSQTFKRLKRFPMVRYALRELFDLMYKEGQPVEMNKYYLEDDFNIELSDKELEKLMSYIEVQPDGKWWITSIKKRISKAEASRENGKKGGRPPKQKKESFQTEKDGNKKPNNPALKPNEETQETPLIKEKEKEKVKEKVKEKGNNARAIQFLISEKEIEFNDFEMQNKKLVKDWNSLIDNFNDKIDIEISQNKIEWESDQLLPRLRSYTRSWISNQGNSRNSNQNQPQSTAPDRY
ncbi:hypothetical protein [Winogradskyella forsetii]|uniref:hypothetical protein n=1 Tax=Winogradskyella forsetii TaxID=2686077 RepID=UPI0015C1190F|nr:hypothetical protein [Winogradskyella forsetii]